MSEDLNGMAPAALHKYYVLLSANFEDNYLTNVFHNRRNCDPLLYLFI